MLSDVENASTRTKEVTGHNKLYIVEVKANQSLFWKYTVTSEK